MVLAASPFTYLPTGSDWVRVLPELILLVTVLVILLADLPRLGPSKGWLSLIGLAGTIGAAIATALLWANGDYATAFYGMMSSDKLSLLSDMVILFTLGVALLLSPGYIDRQGVTQQGEYYALLVVSGLGMMFMASGDNLMIIFVGLEILSLSLYILSAFIIDRARSQEAGMKYFILSSFASAFLLYGMAMTYGATGTTGLPGIRQFLTAPVHPFTPLSGYGPFLVAGFGLMAVGFCFKVSAVPFQAWTPDVYVGAPTSITAFMSVGTKVAAFVALARVFVVAFQPVAGEWTPVFWVIAVLTMIVGNFLAVTQRDVKRMLAYSSVANAGYMLVAIVTATPIALASLIVYLAGYAAMNLGAFGCVLAIERNDGLGTTLDDFAGLARRRPAIAAIFAVCLFALAGIPATIGFAAKFYLFYAAVLGGHLELAIIGVLCSVAGMFYYLRVIWAMYFTEQRVAPAANAVSVRAVPAPEPAPAAAAVAPASGGAAAVAIAAPEPRTATAITVASDAAQLAAPASAGPMPVTAGTWLSLALAVFFTVALGIIPGGLFDFALQAAHQLLG